MLWQGSLRAVGREAGSKASRSEAGKGVEREAGRRAGGQPGREAAGEARRREAERVEVKEMRGLVALPVLVCCPLVWGSQGR